MPRDYAQRGNGSRRQATGRPSGRRSGGGLPSWVWLAAGLSLGLAVAAFVYISRPPAQPMIAEPADTRPEAKAERRKSGPIALPPKEKQRFTFYEILRDQEVVVPREQTRAATPPGTLPDGAVGDGSYVIQVASFRSQADADRQKASLALIGIESRIESVTIDGKDTYYRVRVGPDNSWSRVQSTMARLEENGIEGLLIRLK